MREFSSDPWTWTELSKEDLLTFSKSLLPEKQTMQFFAVHECLALRQLIEADQSDSGFAVLKAVSLCAKNGLVMPDWLATAFMIRFRAVAEFEALSWDSPLSFGRPYRKGVSVSAGRKKYKYQWQVYLIVKSILREEPKTPIDKSLFERVGKPLGLGATLTEEYYYSCKREQMASYIFRIFPNAPAKNRKLAGRLKRRL